ncbi:rhomboid family intramembrane serine protease [Devriesea agamarum]|uniref:rhomboid family intramembrane serine protease n=1 Tax=Devriesea agamarum TaxID=472569 RepID=UPI00071D5A39|nr:rhomboid family intramembrane serine protease [Devriesea agamarum]
MTSPSPQDSPRRRPTYGLPGPSQTGAEQHETLDDEARAVFVYPPQGSGGTETGLSGGLGQTPPGGLYQTPEQPRTVTKRVIAPGTPVVTYTVIALCVLAYLGQMLIPEKVEFYGAFMPALAADHPWTFLTAGFLHAGVIHIVFNMYVLWVVGRAVEQAYGWWRYLTIYLVSIIAGNVTMYVTALASAETWITWAVGASGGVFGLFGALFILAKKMHQPTGQILILVAINLFITFYFPNIAWQAHVGGLVVGTAIATVMLYVRPRVRPWYRV